MKFILQIHNLELEKLYLVGSIFLKTTREQINNFLSKKNITLIGVSRNPQDFTRNLFRDLKQKGYNLIPINPYTKEIDGEICYPDISSLREEIDAALIFTSTLTTVNIVEDLIKKGIKNIWIHNGDNKSKMINSLVESLKERKINIIQGYCPYMFLPDAQLFHRFHGFFVKLLGKYPS